MWFESGKVKFFFVFIYIFGFFSLVLQKLITETEKVAYLTMTVEYTEFLFFRSDLNMTSHRKNDTNLKKIRFLNTMVGTFCAICSATGNSFSYVWSSP